MVQEYHWDRVYTYVYTAPDSYEPLAQIVDYTDQSKEREINYFHCDQIGVPREMTDSEGNVIWCGEYDAWGSLKTEHKRKVDVHQPFRLQNQYCDTETGLHYNFFRYYASEMGRFTTQDPIGLLGEDNFYIFAPNTTVWVDWLGLAKKGESAKRAIQEMERLVGSDATHGLRRHGSGTTLQQQLYRSKTGKCPDGIDGSPQNATRFLSYEDQLDALKKVLEKYSKEKPRNGYVEIEMGRIVAEGFLKGGKGSVLTTSKVAAQFNAKTGKFISIYGKL